MLLYRWNRPSPVASAEIEKRMEGYWATLRFSPDALLGKNRNVLADLPQKMADYGLRAYADIDDDGEHILRIASFSKIKPLFSALRENHLITAENPIFSKRKTSLLRDDGAEPKGLWGYIAKYATRLRGISGQIGDIFLLSHWLEEKRLVESGEIDKYAKTEKRLIERNSGLSEEKKAKALKKVDDDVVTIRNGSKNNLWLLASYASQSAIHTFFGAGKSEIQFDELISKVKKTACSAGGALNEIANIKITPSERSGALRRLYLLFQRNAVVVSESIPIFGNWKKMSTGLKFSYKDGNQKDHRLNLKRIKSLKSVRIVDHGQFWTGVAHFVANIIGAYIPEQTRESIEADPNSPWFKKNRLYQWIAARPIKIQSWITILDKPFMQIPGAWQLAPKLKKRRTLHMAEIGFYTLGRVFGAAASKNSEKPNHIDAYSPFFAMISNFLVGVPKEKLEKTISALSEELAQEIQKKIGQDVDAGEISARIKEKLTALQDSPFLRTHRSNGNNHGGKETMLPYKQQERQKTPSPDFSERLLRLHTKPPAMEATGPG